VLDGEQMSWKEFGEKNLQPEQIMQMSVLKDKSATDKYGQKGQFGVIEITTLSSNSDLEKAVLEKEKLKILQQEKQLNKKEQQLYQQEKQKQLQSEQQLYKQEQLKQQQSQQLYQQQKQLLDQQQMQHNKVFTKVEHPAKFPGGDEAWKIYLERNLNTKVNAPKGVYTVHVQFIVNEDGSIRNVIAETPKKCPACAQEAGNLIKKGPKWEPAVQNGRNVVYQTVKEITFNVD